MGDEGLAVGAALAFYNELASSSHGVSQTYRLKDVYFGQSYSDVEIKAAIDAPGLEAEYLSAH